MSSTYQPLTEPVRFTDGKRTFVYIYKKVSLKMAENAISIQEFQSLALQKPPGSITDLTRSGAADWPLICCSYLLREEIAGELQRFSGDFSEAFAVLSDLEGQDAHTEVRRVLEDFFTGHGRREQILRLLRGEQSLDAISVLSTVMTALASGQNMQGLLQSAK